MIIIGYQGIGKSTLAGTDKFVDLESTHFWVDAERDGNWFKVYGNIAIDLSQQGYDVFTSSHMIVLDYLMSLSSSTQYLKTQPKKEKMIIICPGKHLEDKWVQKLEERYHKSMSHKDFKAYIYAKTSFQSNIEELESCEIPTYFIDSMSYDLKSMIYNIKKENGVD